MADPITAAQMRALEQAAIASGQVTGLELMERAGAGVVDAIFAEWPELSTGPQAAAILCGPGNNGGDGFVIARLLAERGWSIDLKLQGDAEHLPPDAKANMRVAPEISEVFPANPNRWNSAHSSPRFDKPIVLIDALFGIGINRPLVGMANLVAQSTQAIRNRGIKIASVDIPSGLDADTGVPTGPCFTADLTVSFHRAKHGHLLNDGPKHCGKLVIKDIGL